MPAASDLPESSRKLAYRHAISVRDETWDADVDRLSSLIAKNEQSGPNVWTSFSRTSETANAQCGCLWQLERSSPSWGS